MSTTENDVMTHEVLAEEQSDGAARLDGEDKVRAVLHRDVGMVPRVRAVGEQVCWLT